MRHDVMAGDRLDDFKMIRPLAAGGMGMVWLARQMTLDRFAALKILGPSADDPRAEARFVRESRAAARLRHERIAEVYYAAKKDDLYYIASRYIDGMSLRQLLARLTDRANADADWREMLEPPAYEPRDGRELRIDAEGDHSATEPDGEERSAASPELPSPLILRAEYLKWCCTTLRDAARTLDYAHQAGVVHRDIKPENLMIDRQGLGHLIDFGIARFRDDVSLSRTGAVIGTPQYMSPEHVTGRVNIDHRSDIYSLGVVLYECLTLQPPFTAETPAGMLQQIVNKAVVPASWRNPEITRDLEAVVHKAMAKDPDERYPSAAAFAEDLQNVLDHKPVDAPRYRYKLDGAEIALDRPILITLTSFFYYVVAIVCLAFALGMALTPPPTTVGVPRRIIYLAAFIQFVITILSLAVGIGLHRGRRLAYISALGLSLVVCVLVTGNNAVRFDYKNAFEAVLYLTFVVAMLFPLAALLMPGPRRWIARASRIRGEYRQQFRQWRKARRPA